MALNEQELCLYQNQKEKGKFVDIPLIGSRDIMGTRICHTGQENFKLTTSCDLENGIKNLCLVCPNDVFMQVWVNSTH